MNPKFSISEHKPIGGQWIFENSRSIIQRPGDSFPLFVIFLGPICNTFNTKFIQQQKTTCQDNYVLKVGDGQDAYDTMTQFFKDSVKGHMARCIMLNPMYLQLLLFVIFLGPICNTFNTKFVRQQWREVETIYNKNRLDIFKAPLVEGDATCRCYRIY